MKIKLLRLISFKIQPFSPDKNKSNNTKVFSDQVETHRSSKTEEEEDEPSSPDVSCMGNIKHKNKQRKIKKIVEGQKAKRSFLRVFFVKPQEKRCGAFRLHRKPEKACRAPKLSHTRRFASRHMLTEFDWRAQTVISEPSNEDCEGENDYMIPFSAPMVMECLKVDIELKPKKEINLWKKRNMTQPRPLQVASFN